MTIAIRVCIYVDFDKTTHSVSVTPDLIKVVQRIETFHPCYVMEFKKATFEYDFNYTFKGSKNKLFCVKPELHIVEDFQDFPDLIMTWTNDDEVDEEFFDAFLKYVNCKIEELPEKLQPMKVVKNLPIQEPHRFVYDYVDRYNDKTDIMTCQISRHQSTQPFVVDLFRFSETGYEKLFYDLHSDPSWGLYTSDEEFLKALWKKLELPDEYDYEKLKEKYDAGLRAYPPDIPPSVSRVSRIK